MLKKIVFLIVLFSMISIGLMASVLDFLPADTSMFVYFENNEENYAKLKEVPLFDFVLQSMGLEFLITLNLNQLATSQGIKEPSQIWDVLKGDLVFFSTASPENMLESLEDQTPSPDEISLEELLSELETMNFCLVIQPKGNSKSALEMLNKLLSAMDVDEAMEDFNVEIMEYSGYILLSNSNELVDRAKEAFSGKNKFADNPEVSQELVKLLSRDAWIRVFSKAIDPEKMLKDLTKSDIEIPARYGNYLGWTYFEDKKLVGNGHVEYEVLDESLKLTLPVADVDTLESQFAFPGQIYLFVNLVDAMKRIDYIFTKISEIAETQDMSEEEEKEDFDITLEVAKNLLTKLDGKISAGVKVGQSATTTSFAVEVGLEEIDSTFEIFLEELAEEKFDYNGQTVYLLGKEDEMEIKAFVENDKLYITSLNPDELKDTLNQSNTVKSDALYNELSKGEKGAQMRLFADLGQILAELVGMPVDSGLLVDIFVGTDSVDTRLVIK
jgi:hypothetical protein